MECRKGEKGGKESWQSWNEWLICDGRQVDLNKNFYRENVGSF
jgi:hypothetical protein